MQKNELRRHYKAKRETLSSETRDDYSIKIANKALELPIWGSSFYHIFLSITKNKEVNTEPILSIIQGKDKNVVVPKVFLKGTLKNFLLTDNVSLQINSLGIPEPVGGIEVGESQLDVVFLPLLAFDEKGYRVGYGGGYYDALLKKCRPETVKIGLSFFDGVRQIKDVHENDVAMDYCITPGKIYEF